MLPRRWMEAYINFLLRNRWAVLSLILALTVFFVYQLSYTKIQMNFMVSTFRYGILGVSDIDITLAFSIILLFIAVLFCFSLYLLNKGTGIKT